MITDQAASYLWDQRRKWVTLLGSRIRNLRTKLGSAKKKHTSLPPWKSKKIYPVRILGMLFMGLVIQKVRCLNKALSVKLNELIGKSTKHSSFETAIPFESNILFGELSLATCSLSSLFRLTSLCGARSRDPHDLQCITLRKCNKDVHPHLK